MNILQSINIYTHIIFGSIILMTGLIPLITQKGSDWHKRAGRVYVGLYTIVLFTAIIGVVFFRSPPALMAITLSASYGFFSGIRALKIKSTGPLRLDNLVSIGALIAGFTLLFFMSQNGSSSWPPAVGYSVIGMTCTYAIYDLSRYFWIRIWQQKVCFIDHGVKITSSYFALASAASGNLLQNYQPWSQILPSVIGTLVTLVFIYLYVKRPNVFITSNAH